MVVGTLVQVVTLRSGMILFMTLLASISKSDAKCRDPL
jgi:hypothetical protein